jgi:hypothetical protein
MKLLNLDAQGIQKLIDEMEQEVYDIKMSAMRFSWYMRGGATYEDILNMAPNERKMISDLIKSNIETTKNTKLPFF